MREESKTCFNNVEMSLFRKTILFRCVRWSCEMRDIMKRKKVSKRNILTVIIRVQCMNVLIEVFFFCDGFESKKYVFYL
jgi:hypothetical protein